MNSVLNFFHPSQNPQREQTLWIKKAFRFFPETELQFDLCFY